MTTIRDFLLALVAASVLVAYLLAVDAGWFPVLVP